MNENKGKEIINNTNSTSNNNNKADRSAMRKKLMKVMLIVIGVLVVILIIILIFSIINGGEKSYEEIEQELRKAAIEYYEVQDGLLPQEEGETVTVKASTLAESGLMKPLSELRKDEECSGRVEVSLVNDNVIYTPYLDCGKNYVTKELYKAVLEQGIVASGNGLYDMNGEKVYRGDKVNNYVQLDHNVFRIVKVRSDNKIELILNETIADYTTHFDNRYNSDRKYNSGFNDYRVSRMLDYLTKLYNETGESALLSNNDKDKLSNFNICLGKRTIRETNNTNAVECSDALENQMIGLLTVSDYLNASIDGNCKDTNDRSCQNYNYLNNSERDWWLITGNSENSYEVYVVRNSGYIDLNNASSYKRVRPVIVLNNNVMIKSGDGSKENPFILK